MEGRVWMHGKGHWFQGSGKEKKERGEDHGKRGEVADEKIRVSAEGWFMGIMKDG